MRNHILLYLNEKETYKQINMYDLLVLLYRYSYQLFEKSKENSISSIADSTDLPSNVFHVIIIIMWVEFVGSLLCSALMSGGFSCW